jgi:hypothetical protein
MKTGIHADKCLSFISCDLNPQAKRHHSQIALLPVVTVSRQSGCGGESIINHVAGFLQIHDPGPCPWTVFDKEIVEKVLEEHKIPRAVAKFMPEDLVSAIQDGVEEMLGLHPPSKTLLLQTTETILHLARLGRVILVGRAANIITREMKNAFHVRLVAPLELRVEHVMAERHLERKAALEFVRIKDRGRQRYVKGHFHVDIDDSLQYDLVVNTARFPHQDIAPLIGDAVLRWMKTI